MAGTGEQGLSIRSFEDADESAVVELWEACFPDQPPRNAPGAIIARKRRVMPELFLVAELKGRIVGAVVGGWDGYRAWAYQLATHPEFQRRGIGTELMRELEDRLRRLGCPKINLQVLVENEPVAAFYASLGYRTEERLDFGKLLADE